MNVGDERTALADAWKLIDAVLVINLQHRPERWNRFMATIEGIIPKEKIHRVEGIYGKELKGFGVRPWFQNRKRDNTWGARAGCTLSHRKALKTASDNNWNNVLVLEDDIEIDGDFEGVVTQLYRSLKIPQNHWDICYLGFTDPWKPFKRLAQLTETRSLHQVFGCNCAHAYLVTPRAREWILSRLPKTETIWKWLSANRAVDRWYRCTLGRHLKVCCVSPSVVRQMAGYSDIVGKNTDSHDEAAHINIVPGINPTAPIFHLRYVFQISHSWIHALYDHLRGFWKQLRGF